MSFKEIVSHGEDLVVEQVGREFGGARKEVLKVDGTTGDVLIQGVKANGAGQVLVAKKVITAAQVAALNSTVVEVIPKPAPGKFIEIISMHALLKYAGVAYDSVGAGDFLELRYTSTSGTLLTETVSPSGFADATADAHVVIDHNDGWIPSNANVVAFTVGSWFGAAGNSPLHLEVLYRVRDLAI